MRKRIETTKVITDMEYWCDDCGKYAYKVHKCYKCGKDMCRDCAIITDSGGYYDEYVCKDCKEIIDKYKDELKSIHERECEIEDLIDYECDKKFTERKPCKYEQTQ